MSPQPGLNSGLMIRWDRACLLLVAVAGCDIDRFLEGVPPPPPPPIGQIFLVLQPAALSVEQGQSEATSLRLSRSGGFTGSVAFSHSDLQPGITASIGESSTDGLVTVAPVLLVIDPSVAPGQYLITMRAAGDGVSPATALLNLTVTPQPAFELVPSPAALTIARGGIALLGVDLLRSHFEGPVNLSLGGVSGITATFEPNPVLGSTAAGTVSVAPGAALATHTVTLTASAAGLADREMPLVVHVTADAIQLLMAPEVSAAQASEVSTGIIVNQIPAAGQVALMVEGLPAGVAAAFQGVAGGQATMTLSIGPATTPGTHALTVRGQGTGVPDATVDFLLHVAAASIAIAANPVALALFPGASAVSTITIFRTAFAGSVSFEVTGLPAGVTATVAPPNTSGTVAVLTVTASPAAAPGQYVFELRAAPTGLVPDAAQVQPLSLTVHPPLPGGGALRLDWTRCTTPDWVAAQDGSGPWTRVESASGVFEFPVYSDRIAFAWVLGSVTSAQYLRHADLPGGLLDMCDPPKGTKMITGTAAHATPVEPEWVYRLGGGTGSSTGANPQFVITNVNEGTHDLVVFGLSATTLPFGQRMLLRRDVNLPDGGSLGIVDLVNPAESFLATRAELQFTGPGSGTITRSMSYLTTAACTINHLHDQSLHLGVPEAWQRPTDFHMLTVRQSSPSDLVAVTEVFHRLTDRVLAWPPASTVSVSSLPGVLVRLQASFQGMPSVFNGPVRLEYSGAGRSARLAASAGYIAETGTLAMPDLRAAAGWQDAFGIPAGTSGTWWATADGDTASGPLCMEGRRTIQATRRGMY